jgi:uncharacterized protein HemY
MHQNQKLGMSFYGAVWNNLGVCYARQLLFKQAAECFETSCEYEYDEEVERQAVLAGELAEGKRPERSGSEQEEDPGDPQRKLLQWEREYRVRQKA